MKKILLSLLPVLAVCLISCEKSDVNSEDSGLELSGDDIIQFEDDNFLLALLDRDVDTNGDGLISVNEAQNVRRLYLSHSHISAMPEIKYFTSLESLWCTNNQLTSLDVSNNLSLKYLYCYGNQLTSLGVSNNSALVALYCSYNQLISLDLSNNLDLIVLECSNNDLTKVILNENHKVGSDYIQAIIDEYGDIIEYVE